MKPCEKRGGGTLSKFSVRLAALKRRRLWQGLIAHISISFAIATALILPAFGGAATLSWEPPTLNTDGSPLTDLSGFRIYAGCSQSGSYDQQITINNPSVTSYVWEDLPAGQCWFVSTAFNSAGVESAYSNEATKLIPGDPVALPGATTIAVEWQEASDTGGGGVMAFPDGWNRRVAVEIQASEVGATLTDFPFLLTAANLPSEMFDADGSYPAQNGGGDIRVTSDEAGNTRLPVEVVSFVTDNNPANGSAEIWVKVPSVSASANTPVYVWYNTAGTESQPAVTDPNGRNAVWSDYEFVFHGDPAAVVDSTGNHVITKTGSPATVTGPWGQNASDFDGVDDIYTVPDAAGLKAQVPLVAQGWIRTDSGTTDRTIFQKRNLSPNSGWMFHETSGENAELVWFGIAGYSQSLGLQTTWRQLSVVVDGAGAGEFFEDGASAGTFTASTSPNTSETTALAMGAFYSNDSYSSAGEIEGAEYRIRHTVLSADWISAEFSNQNTPGTFAVAGTPDRANGWTEQPAAGTALDTSHAYYTGLVAAHNMADEETADLLGNALSATYNGSAITFVTDAKGRALELDGTSAGVLAFDTADLPDADLAGVSGLTVLVVADTPVANLPFSSWVHTITSATGSQNRGWGFQMEQWNGSGNVGFTVHHGNDAQTSIASPVTDPYVATLSWDGTTAVVDVLEDDGGSFSDSISVATGAADALTGYIVGGGIRRASLSMDGFLPSGSKVYFVAVWNRDLSAEETASLRANPWQLFEQPSLDDDIVFAHFGDSLTEDHPATPGAQSNPGALTDPAVSGGALDFDGTNAISYAYGSNIWDVGTGDFTIAVRATYDTLSFDTGVLIHLGTSATFANNLLVQYYDGGRMQILESYSRLDDRARTNTSVVSAGVPFTAVVVRRGDQIEFYIDGTNELDAATDTLSGASYSVDAADDITLGAELDGSAAMDGQIEWVAAWDRALTASEIANNMNEADLKAALGIGGGGNETVSAPVTAPQATVASNVVPIVDVSASIPALPASVSGTVVPIVDFDVSITAPLNQLSGNVEPTTLDLSVSIPAPLNQIVANVTPIADVSAAIVAPLNEVAASIQGGVSLSAVIAAPMAALSATMDAINLLSAGIVAPIAALSAAISPQVDVSASMTAPVGQVGANIIRASDLSVAIPAPMGQVATNITTRNELSVSVLAPSPNVLAFIPGEGGNAMSLVDERFSVLSARFPTVPATTTDLVRAWLIAEGGTGESLTDLWFTMLLSKGVSQRSVNDMWFEVLGINGFTQATLNDRELAFWQSGGILA